MEFEGRAAPQVGRPRGSRPTPGRKSPSRVCPQADNLRSGAGLHVQPDSTPDETPKEQHEQEYRARGDRSREGGTRTHLRPQPRHDVGRNRCRPRPRTSSPSSPTRGRVPQAFSQLSTPLDQALDTQILSMDSLSAESDRMGRRRPPPPGGGPRSRGGTPQAPRRRLQSHRTHHSPGVDDGKESMRWDRAGHATGMR